MAWLRAAADRRLARDQPCPHPSFLELYRPQCGAAADLFDRHSQHSLDRYVLEATGQPLLERRLERRQSQLVDANRSRQGMAGHLPDCGRAKLGGPEDDAGLRSADELVAGESDHVAMAERV